MQRRYLTDLIRNRRHVTPFFRPAGMSHRDTLARQPERTDLPGKCLLRQVSALQEIMGTPIPYPRILNAVLSKLTKRILAGFFGETESRHG